MKPERFQSHKTLAEVAREVNRDPSYIRRLEKDGRIPQATRYEFGKLAVRLWSPAQIKEIKVVLSKMKVGNPHGKNR